MNWCKIWKAAGDGNDSGSTGMLIVDPDCAEAMGSLGRVAQCDARTRECTGKIMMGSLADGDLDPDTARACVGCIAWVPDTGTEIDAGNCERGMEVGMWDRGRLEMPASICVALGLRPLRMYSTGTFESSGAAAIIESRDTSAKEGRARLRGSWTFGELGAE